MAHEAESQSPAIQPAAASYRRKSLILLCSEDLRFVACGLEEALRERGWAVRVEYGRDARPWVQQVPVERPSVRILCVPGSVDREFAEKLRGALAPDPDADLHILGVDDSPGLVQEIEALAGVPRPRRRPHQITARLVHPTLVERSVQSDRSWRFAAAAVAMFAITAVGSSMLHSTDDGPTVAALPAASLTTTFTAPVDEPITSSRFDDPVLSAVAPYVPKDDYELDPIPEEEDMIEILDDEPAAAPTTITITSTAPQSDFEPDAIGAPPLDEPIGLRLLGVDPAPVTVTIVEEKLQLPPGFLPVGDLTVAAPSLPKGFLPVAGMGVTPGMDPVSLDDIPTVITYDPFVPRFADATSAPLVDVQDPFVSVSDAAAP